MGMTMCPSELMTTDIRIQYVLQGKYGICSPWVDIDIFLGPGNAIKARALKPPTANSRYRVIKRTITEEEVE